MNKWIAILLGILVCLLVVIVAAPASLVIGQVRGAIEQQLPGLNVGEASGSIWRGETSLQYGDFPVVTANWDLQFLNLLTGVVAVDIRLNGPGIQAEASGEFDGSSGQLNAPFVSVDSQFINQATVDRGLSLSGTFTGSNIEARFDQQFVRHLQGAIDWPGGLVHIQTPQQTYSSRLPPLSGQLGSDTDRISLTINDGGARLVSIDLKRDGWAMVDVTYDFMLLAGLPVPGADTQQGQASAILIEEKVL